MFSFKERYPNFYNGMLDKILYSDFIEDFILDKLEDLEESRDIKILHIEPFRDYNVNVYNL